MEMHISLFHGQNKLLCFPQSCKATIIYQAAKDLGWDSEDFYLLNQGKIVSSCDEISSGATIHIVPRLRGGKGGFGSMLRAIGAQIEKTTNREACRDLSGRRLRDINEEKRLKTWINQQADRERDAAERKRKKLERLCAEPKLEFKDAEYEAARSGMTEKVADAVEQGFKAAASSTITSVAGSKRNAPSTSTSASGCSAPKKKKTCLWLDSDEADLSSSPDSDDSDDEAKPFETIASKNSNMSAKVPETPLIINAEKSDDASAAKATKQ